MIVEIGLCGAAGFLFLRGIYHSGVLAGWITQGLSMSTRPKAPPPAPAAAPAAAPKWDQDRYETDLFLATGEICWWLDPNRWGDNPNWREKHGLTAVERQITPSNRPLAYGALRQAGVLIPEQTYKIVERLPDVLPCPNCGRSGHAYIKIMAQHDDEATMMECERCGCEFTKAGPTKRWTRAQKKAAKSVRMVEAHPAELPCGCSWNESITQSHGPGYGYSRCNRCEKWWELPSNGQGKGRIVAQGEHVHDKDDMTPTAQHRWEQIRISGAEHHGVCPSYLCQMPVAKRGGLYYCTNTDCHRHYGGWK